MKAQVYNIKGEKIEEQELPENIFNVEINDRLIHDVMIAYKSNQRQNIAHTKDRGDVRGGGKKPWKQKGTGRARHGSIRSPLWVGGGVTFGPKNERNFKKKINKKVARQALKMVLSDKANDRVVSLIDSLEFSEKKTKTFENLLNAIVSKNERRVLFITNGVNDSLLRCVQNIPSVEVITASDVNAYDVVRKKAILMSKDAVIDLEKRLSKN